MEELLTKLGIDRDTLKAQEIETLDRWAKALSVSQQTPVDVKNYINDMITAIEREAFGHDTPKTFTSFLFGRKRKRFLEARLYNYILLRDFLTAPDRARSYVEKHLKNLEVKKG